MERSNLMMYNRRELIAMLLGGKFLDYDVLAHTATEGQHLGIFLVELGVGITVSSTMLLLYLAFVGREPGQ